MAPGPTAMLTMGSPLLYVLLFFIATAMYVFQVAVFTVLVGLVFATGTTLLDVGPTPAASAWNARTGRPPSERTVAGELLSIAEVGLLASFVYPLVALQTASESLLEAIFWIPGRPRELGALYLTCFLTSIAVVQGFRLRGAGVAAWCT